MIIKLNYFGKLTDISGSSAAERKIDECSLLELLETLKSDYPEMDSQLFAVFLNNKKATDLSVQLNHGDEISLMPPFAGG